LSHDQAREISVLIAQGVRGKVIADRYGVARRTVYAALARLETEDVPRETELLARIARLEAELAQAKGEPAIKFRHGCKWCGKLNGCIHDEQKETP
jgi:DNA-binding CsgD family transcriptional regulator